ncbi:MAG TPA: hypothetical protein PLI64_11590 [Phycisphaerae bacterium]|nr:hypothetical protein [Phycisphaerae bacterium]
MPSPTFTAPATPGAYCFTCTVTDTAGATFSDSVSITVGMGLSASITAVKQSLPSGQTTGLSVTVNGGTSPYSYAWSVLNPAGGDATAALSATNVPDPIFTAPASAGTYRVTCTVSDAAGASFPATLHLQVGMSLSLDVLATKSSIPAAGGTALLLAIANGGTAPYSYAWTAVDPSDADAAAALSATNVPSPTFTAPATAGTYRFTCMVTDTAGATFSDSVSITVGMGLSASIAAVKQSLPSGQTTALNVTVNGGVSPYTYAWNVLDPAGSDAASALSAVDEPDPTFTAPANAGTYRLTCTVSDAAGASFPATLHLQVGMPLSLDVVATKSSIPAAGGTASLLAIANGGTAPYSYAWTAVDPSGGNAVAALSATNVSSPTFTAPATPGTYRFICTVTDTVGVTFSDSVSITVGMGLSASISAVKQSLPSGQTTALSVTVNGGVSPYTYTWSVLDPAGDDATAALSATNVSDPTFAAPAGAGTYRLTCTVSDAAGASFPATLHLQVGMPLSLDVVATKSSIPAAGGTATLLAIANGGTAPYSYAWTAIDPSGGNAVAALSATNVSSPTFTAPATPGTYRFTCTVTDAAGATFSDSVSITVGMGLSASISAVKQSLPSGQTTALNVTVNGGTSPYSYAWSVLDPAGDDATTALSAVDVPDPTFTAPANAGTYRLTCTVSDAAGASFPATLHLQVGMPLSLDVVATKSSLPAAGGTTSLLAIANGGTAPYSYAWTAVDPSGGDAATALSATNVASPTFTAPATAGTYRFTCTVTDAAGTTFSDSVSISVGMGLSASITAVRQSLPSGQTTALSVTVNGGVSPYTYAWSILDPANGDATAALSAADAPDPIFTAPASTGTYRLTCTVSDAAGASFPATLHLQVGMPLSLDVVATKSSIPAAGGTATLLAIANGGTAPYSYAWTAIDPSGGNAVAALSATNVSSPTFTAPATPGTYRFTCTVTDAAGATFSDSVSITVGMGLSASISAVKQSLPSGQTTALNVTVNGGTSPYSYAWSVLDPAGDDATTALSAVDVPDPTFTAPANAGTYRLTCTVSDAAGASFPATLHLQVGMPLSLDVVATKSSLPAAGGTTSLLAIANGGTAPYSYAWTAVDPSGGDAATALSATNVASPTFTAPATAGTYRFTCTVTDAAGTTFSDSVSISVGMGLSASITAVRQSLPSGQTTALSVTVNGGVSPYTYAWSILDPANGDATAALSAADAPDPIFTAPASTGTYRLTCTVSDAAGASFPATLHLQVGVPLSLDVIATKSSIPAAGGTASLLAVANGGTAPYSYAWAAVDPSGADAVTTLSATNVPSPTFTAPAAAGTYRFTCAVTDAAGATFSDSVNIIVGMPLSAHAFASRISLSAGQTSTLSVGTVGGLAPFTYAWVVLDPGGNPISALNDPAASSPVFTAPATPGTYRITCTVTDAASATAVAVLHLNVEMPLSLVVVTDKDIMTATSTTYLAAIPTGGVPGYTYSWSVVNPALQDVTAATLSSDTAQYPLFTAPILGGTYKVFCTVTDAQNTTFTSAVHIFVATNMLELTAPAAADSDAAPNSILSRNFPGSTQNIVFEVDAAVKNLPHARNLKVRVFDGGSPSLNGVFYIAVDGVSADGHFQTEYFRFTGEGTVEGEMCFARVDMVRWVRTQNSSVPASNDGVMVGVGNTFGLPEILPSPASVRRVVRLPSTTLATPADYTVITTPGRQGVRFTNPAHVPNGSNSYQIFYDDN